MSTLKLPTRRKNPVSKLKSQTVKDALSLGQAGITTLVEAHSADITKELSTKRENNKGSSTKLTVTYKVEMKLDEANDVLDVTDVTDSWTATRGGSAGGQGAVPLGETLKKRCESCGGSGCDNCDQKGHTGEDLKDKSE